jgi:hypothetical protein
MKGRSGRGNGPSLIGRRCCTSPQPDGFQRLISPFNPASANR